jgi:thymidylate synthase (FAD)
MTIEITTHLAIATQLLRHRSFTFQQFSQRYADAREMNLELPLFDLREQDVKNRQNSTNTISEETKNFFYKQIDDINERIFNLYNDMLEAGIAKESARFILPQSTITRMYMTGNIRSWIHYIVERKKDGVQQEHKDIALLIKKILQEELPTVGMLV